MVGIKYQWKLKSYLNRILPRPLFFPFWMTRSEKEVFDKYIRKSNHYLEFGMGGSTIWALLKSDTRIYCVESSRLWINELRSYFVIRSAERNKRLFIENINIGEIGKKGYPVNKVNQHNFSKYSSQIFYEIKPSEIDCVLIDGRFRVACILQTILHCQQNDGLHILIHDIWTRPHYHIVLKYLLEIERVDSMGVFGIRKEINVVQVKEEYERFKYNPL